MPEIKWNASLYDAKHGFVSKFGEDLIAWLQPVEGERILDLGCGTGQLAAEIAAHGAVVTGMDASPDMIAKAKNIYNDINFLVGNATDFSFHDPFDAVFSNATLHWIHEKEEVMTSVYENLKTSGRFVLEMGGKHNVESILLAVTQAMKEEGLKTISPVDGWYFPSPGEYISLLEKNGFTVNNCSYFARETQLKGEDGMTNWLKMFGGAFFKGLEEVVANKIISNTVDSLRGKCYRDDNWYADYVRLRIKATKN